MPKSAIIMVMYSFQLRLVSVKPITYLKEELYEHFQEEICSTVFCFTYGVGFHYNSSC